MRTILMVVLGGLMLAVLGVLVAGMAGVVRGGDPARSNRLMQWRVGLQAAALLAVVGMLMLMRH